jgi:membrane-associated protease RseP (regulator of RpoE activity)
MLHISFSLLIAIICSQSSVYGYSHIRISKNTGFKQSPAVKSRISKGNNDVSSTSLHAILPTVYSAVAVAAVIAFHEAGHFIAAKAQGMKVQSYNVGYGPKILSFNDSQNTEFALRIIPLGGYVAFPNNLEIDEESGEVIKELDDPNLLQNRPPLQRALVISGGVLANFLLTFLLASGTALTNGIGHPTFYSGLSVTTTSTGMFKFIYIPINIYMNKYFYSIYIHVHTYTHVYYVQISLYK